MASVKVAVRVRPLNDRELRRDAQCIVQIRGRQIQLFAPTGDYPSTDSTRTRTFTYDFSYWSVDAQDEHFASQEKVFSDLGTIVLEAAFCGYNACVFAYGQTGAGKTYSMMGWDGNAGLTPRICHGLFGKASEGDDGATYRAEVSYLEIYNERVRDLMVDCDVKNRKPHNLRVREHPMSGPYVEGLTKHSVTSVDEVLQLIDLGNKNRTTAATQMNDVSSRSHAIFTLNFTQARIEDGIPCETTSKINLVDLAGSERVEASGATGDRLREGSNINKSLSTLGLVISALATRSQNQNKVTVSPDKKLSFIPYRDSVLTWLLKDSIGGNAKTIMLAAISPADINYGETLSTLRYATRAKSIVNKPVINEDPTARLIRELRKEIEDLHKRLHQVSEQQSPSERQLQTRLHQNEALVATLTNQWEEKWQRAHTIMQSKGLTLSDAGATVTVDTEKPYLVAIDHDPLNASVTMCYLEEGISHIGSDPALDIVLNGNGIQSHHCSISVDNDSVVLRPSEGAFCYINGEQVINEAKLWQGCIMKLGESHLFRFNHPAEAARMRELADTEQAYNTQFQRAMTAEKLGLTPPRRGSGHSSGWPGHASLELEIDEGLDKIREGQRVMEALFRQQKQRPAEPVLSQCDRDIWMIEEKIRQDQHRLNMQRTQLKQLRSQMTSSQRDNPQNQAGFVRYEPVKSQPLFKSHSESALDEVELSLGYNTPRRTPSKTNTRLDFSKEQIERVHRDSASLQVQIDETEQRLQAEKETLRALRQQQLGVDIHETKEESGESMKLVTYDQGDTEEETEVRYQTDSGSSWVVVNRRTSQGSSPAVDHLHPDAHGKPPRKTVLEVFYRSKDSTSGIRSAMANGRSIRDEDVDIFERSVQDLNFDTESLSKANLLDMEQPMGQRPETMGEEQDKGDRFEDSDDHMMRSSHLSWFCCYNY